VTSNSSSANAARPRKRNYPRAPVSLRVKYGPSTDASKEGFSGTLGGGGVFIESVSPLPVGSEIHIDFSLPGRIGHIRIEGLVVWSRPEAKSEGLQPGMGVQFKKLMEDDREKILELVMKVLMGKSDMDD
jgi:type IV pilus assembly protein PilZ